DDVVDLAESWCERLLHEHRTAGGETATHELRMERMRRADDHRVGGNGQQRVEIARRLPPVRGGDLGRALAVGIEDPDHADAGLGEGGNVRGPEDVGAGGDHDDPERHGTRSPSWTTAPRAAKCPG